MVLPSPNPAHAVVLWWTGATSRAPGISIAPGPPEVVPVLHSSSLPLPPIGRKANAVEVGVGIGITNSLECVISSNS